MKNLLLIVNPVAGKMRLRGALLDILKIYGEKGYRVTTAVTLYRGHGTELAAEAEAQGKYQPLIDKLKSLGNKYFDTKVSHVSNTQSIRRTDNKQVLFTVSQINDAIDKKRKINTFSKGMKKQLFVSYASQMIHFRLIVLKK